MSIELVRDVFKIDQVIGENMVQTIVEGDILVPDTKPDVTRVLTADGKIQLTKQELMDNKITVEGTVYFKILYVSEKGNQPLYSIDSSADFKQGIEIEGLNPKMKAEVTAEVEHIDFIVNNERKIGVKTVINLVGKGIQEKTIEITRDVTGLEDIQVLKESFQYTDLVGIGKSETLVKDSFELGEEAYEIKEILKWDTRVLERESKITDGKVIVGGVVNLDLLYVEDDFENPIKIIKREIPFTHFLEMAHAYGDMKYKLKLSAEELYYDIKENINGERKVVEIEVIVKVEAKVMDTQSREILVDTYSPGKNLKIHRNQIQLNESLGMNRAHILLRETLDIPSGHPPISEIFSVNMRPILTDYSLTVDKAMMEGILEATVIYKAMEGPWPLYSFVEEVPFRHYVDMEGLSEDMEAEVELFVEETQYNIINGEQVELKVNLGASCEAYCKKALDVIENIEELEENLDFKSRPSLTIYFMQPGDSLWTVAKKYNTTVKQIMATNGIDEPAVVKAGDHIIIEKIHNFKL